MGKLKRIFSVLLMVTALLLVGVPSASAADAEQLWLEVKPGTKLYREPSESAEVLDTAGKGWRVHAEASQKGWYEVFELTRENGEGPLYAYLLYRLPGTNAFVRAADVLR